MDDDLCLGLKYKKCTFYLEKELNNKNLEILKIYIVRTKYILLIELLDLIYTYYYRVRKER